jgi:predicted ATPase/DNA-binding XRE family transcriptional regulator
MEVAVAEVTFGDWLKRRRNGLGLTQDQLALQINCSTSALRKFESEERRPSAETIEGLADIFDIPPEERKSFLRFARGDWQAFDGGDTDDTDTAPWHSSDIDGQSNLPSILTSFIGREKEHREVIDLLKKNRLVTLAGAGGIGKTRLAIQVGHQLLHDYPHGVWFIPLDSLSDPLLVPQTVASVFGIRESADRQVTETLKNVLRRKTSLLILDNCEHLLDACAQLVMILLTHCPNLKILTTSREILKMEGEATYYLPSLSTPKEGSSLENLDEYESIQLFVERAALTKSSFQFTKENAQATAEICRGVDGIPLAIELLAARVNILKIEEISEQLRKSITVLANNGRRTPSRHKSLQASIDWSWSLLTDSEQVFLRQLSVYAGGWTLESAGAVCDGNALNLTNSLALKSLIIVENEMEHETRYHFHEILRQYAHEKLVESGEEETVRNRHLNYFLRLSEQIEAGLLGNKQREWFTRALDERDNLRAALELASKEDIEAGLYISGRLKAVWQRYDMREGVFWLAGFLQRPESKQYPLARARALCTQGWLLSWRHKIQQARDAAEESLALFHARNDRPGEIDALILLGATYSYTRDQAEMFKIYQQALTLSQTLGDIWRQARINYRLGWDQGHYYLKRSLPYLEKALDLFSEAGDQRSQADTLCCIGNFRLLNGEIELAQEYLDEAQMLFPIDEIDMWVYFQIAKSIIALEHGDYEQAHTLLQETLVHAEKLGNRFDYMWAQVRFGYLALRQGNISEAREVFAETAEEFQKNKVTGGVVFTLEGMAGLLVAISNPPNAARLIGWADATRKGIKDPRTLLEQRDVDKVIATCISKMGEVAFADAYDEGQVMTLDVAVVMAFNEG